MEQRLLGALEADVMAATTAADVEAVQWPST